MATHLVHSASGVDISNVEPAETRRALRQVIQMLMARIDEQQTEIEALTELLIDRHVISVGELKSAIRRIQQRDDKAARFHTVMAQAMRPVTPLEDISASVQDADEDKDSVQRPNVYRL